MFTAGRQINHRGPTEGLFTCGNTLRTKQTPLEYFELPRAFMIRRQYLTSTLRASGNEWSHYPEEVARRYAIAGAQTVPRDATAVKSGK